MNGRRVLICAILELCENYLHKLAHYFNLLVSETDRQRMKDDLRSLDSSLGRYPYRKGNIEAIAVFSLFFFHLFFLATLSLVFDTVNYK